MLTVILFFVNFLISIWNAHVAGQYWSEKKLFPPYAQLLMWCAAGMSVCGFFATYIMLITPVMQWTHFFEFISSLVLKEAITAATVNDVVEIVYYIAYLLLIFPVIGIGFIIWIDSVAKAVQERTARSFGVAAWNSYAQFSNIFRAFRYVPKAVGGIAGGFRRTKSKNASAFLVVVLVSLPLILSLGGAILTTSAIMRASDKKYVLTLSAA